MLERVADVIEPTLVDDAAQPAAAGARRPVASCSSWAARSRRLGAGAGEAVEVLTGAARPILDRWFESEQLKATLATDAIIGAFAAPSMPGTAYVLFHHVMGETNGKRGVWAYVRGGMGGLTQALAKAARGPRRRDPQRGRGGAASSCAGRRRRPAWRWPAATSSRAPIVASNVDAHVTFTRLLDPRMLPPDFAEAIERIGYESASLKINVALSELPNFTRLPGHEPGPQHRGTDPHLPRSGLHRARLRRRQVRPAVASDPILECTMPSVVDPTRGAAGQAPDVDVHPVRAVQAAARAPGTSCARPFADRCFDMLDEYAPNFKRSVIARQVLTPLDLERVFNLTGGNIFQGAMTLEPALLLPPGRRAAPTTARRSRACTCAARRPTPAAASWAPPASTPPAKSSARADEKGPSASLSLRASLRRTGVRLASVLAPPRIWTFLISPRVFAQPARRSRGTTARGWCGTARPRARRAPGRRSSTRSARRLLGPGEAAQVDGAEGRDVAAQIGLVGRPRGAAVARRASGRRSTGRTRPRRPRRRSRAPRSRARQRGAHVDQTHPEAVADAEAQAAWLGHEQEERVVERQQPGPHARRSRSMSSR